MALIDDAQQGWINANNLLTSVTTKLQTLTGQLQMWASGTITGGDGSGKYPITAPDGTNIMIPSPARMFYDFSRIRILELTGSQNYNLNSSHYGYKVRLTGTNTAAPITVALPNDAPVGTEIILRGVNSVVKLSTIGAATLVNAFGYNASLAANAAIGLTCESNPNGTSAVWVFDGPGQTIT